jgi:hypothetical protein
MRGLQRTVAWPAKRCDILCELSSVSGPPFPPIVPRLAMPLRHDIAAVTANGRVVVSLAVRPNCHFIECPVTRIDGAIGRLPMKVFLLLVTCV